MNVMTGTYQRPVVTLLLSLEVSQHGFFCSWFCCSGRCQQKASLIFPQWKRIGWVSVGQHRLEDPSSSCQIYHWTETPILFSWLLIHFKKHAEGRCASPPTCTQPTCRSTGRRNKGDSRVSKHTCSSAWDQDLRSCA